MAETGLISRRAAIDALRAMQTYKLVACDDMLLIDQAEAQTELMMLPTTQTERMCYGCRYERHGSVVCDNCSRFFLDRYEVDNNG